MEALTLTAGLLENISRPAFLAANGIITQCNTAAVQHQFTPGTEIRSLITIGTEEYEAFSSGRLSLTLANNGVQYAAVVLVSESGQLFCLEPDIEQPELSVLALAAQHLRGPLSTAMTCTGALLPNESLQELAEVQLQLARINKSLHSLQRAICNMSDAGQLAKPRSTQTEYRNAAAVFDSILEKASAYAEQTGRHLNYTGSAQSVGAMIDEEKLERAVLNLISNAIKFSPSGSTLSAELRTQGKKLYFSIYSPSDSTLAKPGRDIFSQFLRAPGLEPPTHGIGLGMTVVRNVAAAHGGTLLMDHVPEKGIRFTISLESQPFKGSTVRSTLLRPGDYTGGYDHALVELADVLPPELYK